MEIPGPASMGRRGSGHEQGKRARERERESQKGNGLAHRIGDRIPSEAY